MHCPFLLCFQSPIFSCRAYSNGCFFSGDWHFTLTQNMWKLHTGMWWTPSQYKWFYPKTKWKTNFWHPKRALESWRRGLGRRDSNRIPPRGSEDVRSCFFCDTIRDGVQWERAVLWGEQLGHGHRPPQVQAEAGQEEHPGGEGQRVHRLPPGKEFFPCFHEMVGMGWLVRLGYLDGCMTYWPACWFIC